MSQDHRKKEGEMGALPPCSPCNPGCAHVLVSTFFLFGADILTEDFAKLLSASAPSRSWDLRERSLAVVLASRKFVTGKAARGKKQRLATTAQTCSSAGYDMRSGRYDPRHQRHVAKPA